MSLPWLAEVFLKHLGNALEMMAGETPSLAAESGAAQPPQGSIVWEETFSAEGAKAWLAGVEASWTGPGGQLLAAAGIDDGDAAMARSTFQETLAQAFSGLASDLTKKLKKEVTSQGGAEASSLPDSSWLHFDLELGGSKVALYLAFSSQMQLLSDPPPAPPAPRADAAAAGAGHTLPAVFENSRTLELLLDVELPVSVSFGRAQLPLKDVIKLTTGSIVELNRTVGEPVEVIVNNCVIARGEVVVVEGNFGVRVQQVISRQERLRTLY